MKKRLLFTVCLLALCFSSLAQTPSPIAGDWLGTLNISAVKLRLVFHIQPDGNGYKATLDSPDQGAKGIPVDKVEFRNDSLSVFMNRLGATYWGVYRRDSAYVQGTFTQGGQSLPLTLRKTTGEVTLKRPQEPKPPYPYKEEQVVYENTAAHTQLAGTLTYPATGSKFPVVILITGSGPQDRDETLMGHKPFLVLADYLTRQGIAVLRVDDRGVGQSTGNFATATSADFAEDVKAGIAYLKTRKEINPKKIGLIGHSEGGMIAPMVAANNPDVAFLVLMAGPGITGKEILRTQTGEIYRKMGVPETEVQKILAYSEDSQKIVEQTEADPQKLKAAYETLIQQHFAGMSEARKAELGINADTEVAQVTTMRSPWMRYFVAFDPVPVLKQVKAPVLAINGTKDVQVLADINLKGIETALKQGGNKHVAIQKLEGLNHLFQKANTGLPAEYSTIEETINPEALTLMGNWVKKIAQ
jgi:pimeloyl-ACP methyl ester carboxylesterase